MDSSGSKPPSQAATVRRLGTLIAPTSGRTTVVRRLGTLIAPTSGRTTVVRTPGTLTAPSSALTTPIRHEEFLVTKALVVFVPGKDAMSAIRIFRPKQNWSVSPRTVLPTGLLLRLIKPQWNYTVVLDDQPVGKIGNEQVRVFEVEPGEHRLHMRFVGLRRSGELRMSLKDGEERQFVCGTSGMGWPTLREASPADVAEIRGASISEPSRPGDPVSPD